MKIKGRIRQIIKPKDVGKMLSPDEKLPIWDFKNTHYVVTIESKDVPKGWFKQQIFFWKKRKEFYEKYLWSVVLKECNYKSMMCNKQLKCINQEVLL
jgi:hypothetical protein